MSANIFPNQLGYRMPAEWELHEATWLSWPHDVETWPDQLPELESIYLEMIGHLVQGEKVHILVHDEKSQVYVSEKLKQKRSQKNVFIHLIETDSPWIRDYGPIFLTGKPKKTAFSSWIFNAWGRKYAAFQKDNQVPEKMGRILEIERFKVDVVLEGGAIDVNGLGSALAVEASCLNPNRNPDLSRKDMERYLNDFLGIRHMIWLEEGIFGDDTDGHIDEVARFVAPRTVVAALEENQQSQNFKVLRKNWERLSQSLDQDGKRLKVITIPMPEKVEIKGKSCPASYANFYIGNKVVLVPIFHQKMDQIALGILKDIFRDRQVIGISAVPLIYGLGAFHCMTQQQPNV
ncbi:MAG: agmatine deiminase family protein [Candidatus Omnitrophica bacterium]|nr:agmatine deiminase family protein [Candidatus Omnitrophota bacterium]